MVGAKKRFEVLKRDGFRCVYCGKNGQSVSLEVDHVIPKSNGGNEDMDNLVCCCRECNIGKGNDTIDEPAKNLYKQKINDTCKKLKDYIYTERNRNYMGNIDAKTATLIKMYADNSIKGHDGYNYHGWILYPPLYGENSIYGKERQLADGGKMCALFEQGGRFCDDVLNIIYGEETSQCVDSLIKDVFDDEIRLPKGNKNKNRYNERLNYKLTQSLDKALGDKNYVLRKYTLFPKLLSNGETEIH